MARHGTWHVDDAAKLGQRIKDARGSMSQRQLARSVGVSPAYISRIERGDRVPTLQLLERVADALGVELVWLRGLDSASRRVAAQPISPAALQAELDAIEAAVGRIRAQLR